MFYFCSAMYSNNNMLCETSFLVLEKIIIFQKMILNYKPIDNWDSDGMARRLSEGVS